MHTASTLLLPSRFLLCVAQFILLVILITSYENYAYAALDADYSSVKRRFLPFFMREFKQKHFKKIYSLVACIVLFIITLTAEFAAMFTAVTVYFNRILVAQTVLHIFGCITLQAELYGAFGLCLDYCQHF